MPFKAGKSAVNAIQELAAMIRLRQAFITISITVSCASPLWADRIVRNNGQTLNGAPTAAGKAIIEQAAGDLPQVRALLDFLPAATTPLNQTVRFVRNGQTFVVPVGSLALATRAPRRLKSAKSHHTKGRPPENTAALRHR